MKKALALFFVTLVSSVSIAAFAQPIDPGKCMFNCAHEGFTYATCSRICEIK
jgi:hypothetical protein